MYIYNMVLIISVRGYTLKYLHGRLIFISIGADNLQYICAPQRNSNVCVRPIVAAAE